jgi:hypothetical protein
MADQGSIPDRKRDVSLLYSLRPALGPTGPLFWVPEAFLKDKSGRRIKLAIHLPSVPWTKKVELYLHSPYVYMSWCLII